MSGGDVKTWSPWSPGVEGGLAIVSQEKALTVFPTRLAETSIWVEI